MNRYLPYLLPLVTVLVFGALIINPVITGFVVKEKVLEADVILRTEEGNFLSKDAMVVVSLGDEVKSLSVGEFIKKDGGRFEVVDGSYTGDYLYRLDISKFGLDNRLRKGEYIMMVEVIYDGEILNSDERVIKV